MKPDHSGFPVGSDPTAALETDGFALAADLIGRSECRALVEALGPVAGAGRRGLLALPAVATLARSEQVLTRVRPSLPAEPRAVRAILFDKSPTASWLVPWHQDLTLALRARADVPGFGPWSVKDGITHVQPPEELLGRMLTVRLHLDAADESKGE